MTNDLAAESNPRWSPDGSSLYYGHTERSVELQLLPVDSGAPRTLLSWPGYAIGGATLSPDGRTALFSSNRTGNGDIWTVPLAGGEPAVLAGGPLDERSDILHWIRRLGCSEQQLRDAVRAVGPDAADVRRYLGR